MAPESHAQTVQYFLDTERDELEYEAARRRPLLTSDFFTHLTQAIGAPRQVVEGSGGTAGGTRGCSLRTGEARACSAPASAPELSVSAAAHASTQPCRELLQQQPPRGLGRERSCRLPAAGGRRCKR